MRWLRDLGWAIGAALLIEGVRWGWDHRNKPAAELIEVPIGRVLGNGFETTGVKVLFEPTAATAAAFGPRAPNVYDPNAGQFFFEQPNGAVPKGWTPPTTPRFA